jgi:serine/threonine-protein kinase PpkA
VSATEIPGYKIIRTLGVGGQATVYLAIQQGFDREVALKVMSPALAADPTFGERFIREAKIVAKLSHKSIVTVYDVGESGNFFYLAMEYMPGGDLKTKIAEGVKTRECLAIIGKLAKALNFAHQKGYIHRDVKSENILFDEDGEPVLTDFGIAKASNSSTQMTQTGKLIGTPEYMSPEQCRGKPVDGRSDLYSLGVILFEMLTRQVPFTGEDSVAVCIKHVTKPLPQLPARLKHMQWLLDSLLAKDPAKRFQSGNELATAIINFDKTGQSQSITRSQQTAVSASKNVAGNLANKTAKRTTDTDEFAAFNDEPDDFDDLHTERRYQITEIEEKSSLGKIVVVILVALLIGGGYFTQDKWYPQTSQWVNHNILGKTPALAVVQSQSGSSQNQKPVSQPETPVKNDVAPSSAQLLQEADALVQFVPQKLDDIKRALKLVATVKTLEPANKNADLIYQTILSTSLMVATTEAEKNNFEAANEWIALVQYEAPTYALLDATRKNVEQLRATFESRQQHNNELGQKIAQQLTAGQLAITENRLSSPQDDNAIDYFQSVLKLDPGNVDALEGLKQVASTYEGLIEKAIAEQSYSRAKAFLSRFNNLSDDQSKKLMWRQKIGQAEKLYTTEKAKKDVEIANLEAAKKAEAERLAKLNDPMVQMRLLGSLDSARSLEAQGALVMPEGFNALEKYRSVLQIDERNNEAKAGIDRIEKTLLSNLTDSVASGDKIAANSWLTQLKLFKENHPQYQSFATAISEIIEPVPVTEAESSASTAGEIPAAEGDASAQLEATNVGNAVNIDDTASSINQGDNPPTAQPVEEVSEDGNLVTDPETEPEIEFREN